MIISIKLFACTVDVEELIIIDKTYIDYNTM